MIPGGIIVKSMQGSAGVNMNTKRPIPPRERILAAASEQFYNEGIRATGVEAIAAHAGTTKMALYRHFQSKDALVVAWLQQVAAHYWATFDAIEAEHKGNPGAEILGWATFFAKNTDKRSHRGCPFINSVAELPDRASPGRQVIEDYKMRQWQRLTALCKAAGLASPEDTASEIMFAFEGAQVAAQNESIRDIPERLSRIIDSIISRQREKAYASGSGHVGGDAALKQR
jgi:AcrR family transcriptional regulator